MGLKELAQNYGFKTAGEYSYDEKMELINNGDCRMVMFNNDTDVDIRQAIARSCHPAFCLHFINDPDYRVRAEVAKRGLYLDELVDDTSALVRLALAQNGYCLDKLATDKSHLVQVECIKHGHVLPEHACHKKWQVRKAVADTGMYLDKLANDENTQVLVAVVNQGYGLEEFANADEYEIDPHVRMFAIYKLGLLTDEFIKTAELDDKEALAHLGIKLDILKNDPDSYIRLVAKVKDGEMDNLDRGTIEVSMECEAYNWVKLD